MSLVSADILVRLINSGSGGCLFLPDNVVMYFLLSYVAHILAIVTFHRHFYYYNIFILKCEIKSHPITKRFGSRGRSWSDLLMQSFIQIKEALIIFRNSVVKCFDVTVVYVSVLYYCNVHCDSSERDLHAATATIEQLFPHFWALKGDQGVKVSCVHSFLLEILLKIKSTLQEFQQP